MTRNQRLAQYAYCRIANRNGGAPTKEYKTFARKFPSLIHACGLAQAVAFALAKRENDYVADLAEVIRSCGHPEVTGFEELATRSRVEQLAGYLRLSRDALDAAGWLKRYVESLGEDD